MGAILRYVVGDERRVAFYAWDVVKQGDGKHDPEIIECDRSRALDPSIAGHSGTTGLASLPKLLMLRRWRKGLARLFVLMIDGDCACLGYTQDWSIHRRELAWLGRCGDIMGPYWTEPAFRGRRLYQRLLLHTVHALVQTGRTYMHCSASASNIASRKGIERAGFVPLGVGLVRRRCCRLCHTSVWLEDLPATVT